MHVTLYIIYLLLGVFVGTLTGITPGLHFNTIAAMAFSLSISLSGDSMALAIFITAMMITHTFVDFVPSTFLGAPEEGTSLSVLPMHRMLLQGQGYYAIYLSTWGSLLSYLFSLALATPFFIFLISFQGEKLLKFYLPVILIAILLNLFYQEGKKSLRSMLHAILIFFLSGMLGTIALHFPLNYSIAPLQKYGGNTLFPIFTGLFGIPVLLLSKHRGIPPQKIEEWKLRRGAYISSFAGTLSGALVGFIPGVTSGIAAVLARTLCGEEAEENYIVALGSVNTANYIFNLLSLFLLLKPRSFAVELIGELIQNGRWLSLTLPPQELLILLITCGISSLLAFFLTLQIGKFFARLMEKAGERYSRINRYLLLFLILMVFLFTGLPGLALLLTATLIGLLPPKLGVMRVHLMGVLIFPLLISYLL